MIDRTDAQSAHHVMEHCIADAQQRRVVLSAMADVIGAVSDVAPSGWSITLHSERISVDIGTWLAFGVRKNSIWLGFVDDEHVPEIVRSAITVPDRDNSFSSVVPNHFAWIPVDEYLPHRDDFNRESLRVVRALAERAKKAPWKASHSPGVLNYLSSELDRVMPEPGFTMIESSKPAISGDDAAEYWKISPGEEGRFWDDWRAHGIATIGWNALGDLTGVTRDAFVKLRDGLKLTKPEYTKPRVEQVWRFAQIAEGDFIVANRGTTEVLGIGRVIGPYYFDAAANHGHHLPVQWFDTTVRRVDQQGWRRTLVALSRTEFETIRDAPGDPSSVDQSDERDESSLEAAVEPELRTLQPVYPLDDLARETGIAADTAAMWVRAIQRKKQAIFYGPPGTGKTFLADKVARHLIGGGDGFMETLQFHPAYSYEDFMEGMRPQSNGGGLSYPVVPGRFRSFCERAARRSGTCVLIIDEINRANLARVLGELMYLLEYRDQSVPLASGTEFRIPENVRIIGTMNTADRSIALVDHALRRRFAFLPLHPDYEVLTRYHKRSALSIVLASLLEDINKPIDAHYRIGISFFLVKDLEHHLGDIWRMEIEPYLEEYFFDDAERCREMRWERVAARLPIATAEVLEQEPRPSAETLAEPRE